MDLKKEALELHLKHKGKLEVISKIPIKNKHTLALAYTPGVAEPCMAIFREKENVYKYTIKQNSVAVVSDGSAVLGLGNIGADAAIPVMEGKCMLMKEFANIDAFPICVKTQEPDEIIRLVRNIAPVFGGINLEDISAPRCFKIEDELQDLGIPVFHDDQHGSAIVVYAALLNAAKVVKKDLVDMRVVISGAGAAGTGITRIIFDKVKDVIVCDSDGIISRGRSSFNPYKNRLSEITNRENRKGSLKDALVGADAFIGVSAPNIVKREMIRSMNKKAIVFAMANPVPEIMPDEAKKGGCLIVGTGRCDYPNQINNLLAFPGVFRGALNARVKRINKEMKMAASLALANYVKNPNPNHILPDPLDKKTAYVVAKAIEKVARK